MLKLGTRSWIVLGCALGVALFAYGLVVRSPGEGVPQASNAASDDDEDDAKRPARSLPHRSASPDPDDDEARGDGLRPRGSEAPPEEVQPEDEAWDELSDAERRARLEDEFSGAVAELEAGARSLRFVTQAEGALSELRAQMYSTKSGRKEHEALEEWLSKVTEGRKDDDGDVEK